MTRVQEAVNSQYQVALARKSGGDPKSYTCYLYRQGLDKILKKCGEETFEAVIAAKGDDKGDTVGELNDVLYHLTVLLCALDVPLDDVMEQLNIRCASEGKTLDELSQVILERSVQKKGDSYTAYLFHEGLDKILKKVGEACSLLLIAAKNGDGEAVAYEAADLLYHLLAMMLCKGISMDALADELERRSETTGNLKQFRQTNLNT